MAEERADKTIAQPVCAFHDAADRDQACRGISSIGHPAVRICIGKSRGHRKRRRCMSGRKRIE